MKDKSISGGKPFGSRLTLESGKYDPNLAKACVESAGYEMITAVLRHANTDGMRNILSFILENATVIPNTSGARDVDEATRIARLIREASCGNFAKIEITRDNKYLLSGNVETLKATKVLVDRGFVAMSYMYPNLNSTRDSKEAGASCIVPLGSPTGSNRRPVARDFIQVTINETDLSVIVDAGIDKSPQVCGTTGMGASMVIANTAIATGNGINKMVEVFALATKAERLAHTVRPGRVLEMGVDPSSLLRDFLR